MAVFNSDMILSIVLANARIKVNVVKFNRNREVACHTHFIRIETALPLENRLDDCEAAVGHQCTRSTWHCLASAVLTAY